MVVKQTSFFSSKLFRQFRRWSRDIKLVKRLTQLTVLIAVASIITTYSLLTSTFGSDPDTIIMLMNVNIVLLLVVGAVVIRKLSKIWIARRQNEAGSRLYSRMAVLFSGVAITPAIIVAVFSALFFNFGVNTWFSEKVSTALQESKAVARSYLEEHKKVIRADVLSMGNDLNRQAAELNENRSLFEAAVRTHAALRNFTEVLVFQSAGDIVARAGLTYVLELEPLSDEALNDARQGDVVLLLSEEGDRVRALVRLERFVDTFLYVGRYLEPQVLAHIDATNQAVDSFEALKRERSDLQISFALVFLSMALLLLLVSVWVGLSIATQLVTPIGELIRAADKVRAGDLSVQVETDQHNRDEISNLKRAFNRMTSQLGSQRGDLIDANRQLDERRRFIETVLSGVSAGIIGLDAKGYIQYPNEKASELLEAPLHDHIATPLSDVCKEFTELLGKIMENPSIPQVSKIRIRRQNQTKTLLARMTAESEDAETLGFVVTFDDITDLINAQRMATWADMARRLAHEIRNPLTPIQLAADRLKRNYAHQITENKENFETFLDVIIRQVDDLGKMLGEFSSFARMPAPQMAYVDAMEIISDCALLVQETHADIQIKKPKQQKVYLFADPAQLRQVFTNILKNAAESIDSAKSANDNSAAGKIEIKIEEEDDILIVDIKDNGTGLSTTEQDQLTEPYFTTKEEGTGLGLSVVAKIIEDHGGRLRMFNNSRVGATVRLRFPKSGNKNKKTETETNKLGDKDFLNLAKQIATEPNSNDGERKENDS